MVARPVDSAIVTARAPWSTKCSVVTNGIVAGGWTFSSDIALAVPAAVAEGVSGWVIRSKAAGQIGAQIM
jgi:hypothetical protein